MKTTVIHGAIAILVIAFPALCDLTGSHPNVDSLSSKCQEKLENLLAQYSNPPYRYTDCDSDCMSQCADTLSTAFDMKTAMGCPDQDDIMRCMNYFSTEWMSFQEECYFFKISECTSDSESESQSNGCNAAAEAEATTVSSNAESADSQSSDAGSAESEASGTGSADSESSNSESGKNSEEAESDASGSNRRRLLVESESESEAGAGAGCFPAFETMGDFEAYLQGYYFDSVWHSTSNTAGIILSVFFWTSLAALGWYLRKPHRG